MKLVTGYLEQPVQFEPGCWEAPSWRLAYRSCRLSQAGCQARAGTGVPGAKETIFSPL